MSKLFYAPIAAALTAALCAAPVHAADVILNEYNAVDDDKVLENGGSDAFWGTVEGNGGDWFEVVVITDMLDMRGWEFVVTNRAGAGMVGGEESWSLELSNNEIWNGVRSGTIVTVSQELGNNVSEYNPIVGQWWLNVRADVGTSGTYITVDCVGDPGCSSSDPNWKVSNNNWQVTIKDSVGGTVIFGPAGEGVTPPGGIGSQEVFKLEEDPSGLIDENSNYNDGSSSSFGQPNVYSAGTMTQDFSTLRSVVPYSKLTDVVITEVLTHSDPGDDWIEIMNTTDDPVDVSGWFISDDYDDLESYQIPASTIIAPRGYVSFTETDLGFAFSSPCGEQAILSEGNGVTVTGPRDFAEFRAVESNRTVGRPLSDPDGPIVRLGDPTMDAGNAQPAAGPVVLNEIMYHPPDPPMGFTIDPEFVELRNITASTVDLFTDYGIDGIHPWKITGGIDFDFATTQTIAPNGYLLVVNFDPVGEPAKLAEFESLYALSGAPVVGPYSGSLSNSSDDVRLRMPDTPEADGNICGTGAPSPFVPYVVVDEVEYFDFGEWPVEADGIGASLERINVLGIGDDASNWVANLTLTSTPASANSTEGAPGKSQQKCVNTLNKDLGTVAKTQNKEACTCFKNESKGSLGGQSVDDCLLADGKGKVGKATGKTLTNETKNCTGTDSVGLPKLSYVGARDGGVVNSAAVAGSVALMEDVFGLDLDSAIVEASSNAALSKCQLAIAKDLKKCADTQLKEFSTCKKNGLKGGSLESSADLSACVGADPKNKVAKACDSVTGKIASDLVKRCVTPGVDLLTAFPGCASTSPTVVLSCLEGRAACRMCLALVEADDLYTDCDIVDNGVDDDTCP